MPNWIGHSKNSPEYRFIAVREPLNEQPLPGMEAQLELPFPAMRLSNGGWHKVFGVVTNRALPGDEGSAKLHFPSTTSRRRDLGVRVVSQSAQSYC